MLPFAHLIACSVNGMRAVRRTGSLAVAVSALILVPSIARALPSGSVDITPITVTQTTGEKPQSKVWKHAGRWWSVLCNSSGTQLRRLDTNTWTNVLQLSTATDAKADVKVVADTAHVLLYRGTASQLVSVQYVPATTSYALWSVRTSTVNITLDSGVEVGTIDVDSQGRMWLASDAATTVNVRWADRPYTTWSAPIQLASGITTDDIASVTAFGGNKIGVLWSNQTTARYGFRTHTDGTTPTTWTADEVPASQSAFTCANALGMADDHLHLAAASNGTVYAAVKTGCDAAIGEAVILLLVRRPAGTWDNAYTVDTDGTRPIVLVNETLNQVSVLYTQANGLNPIVYKDSPTSAIAFGSRQTVISGAWNDVTSTKQIIGSDAVIMASSTTQATAVYRGSSPSFTITASAGSGGSISPSGSVSVPSGSNQSFTITPNAGFTIANVTVDGVGQGAISTFTFNNVTATHTISATFQAVTTTFTINASAGSGGSISPTGAVTVNSGANQTFTITPNAGFHVQNVVVDGSSVGAQTSFTFNNVTANHTISASFAINTFTITATAGAGGIISPSGGVTVNSGANQQFTISPAAGFHIFSVVVDGVAQAAATTFTFNNVTANHTIHATFAINTFTITASAGSGGSISPSGAVTVNSGANQSFTISPSSGFHVVNVLVDGASQGAVTSFTFNNVTANHTISATFAANTVTFTITASAGSGGSISPSG
ncbi:MAG TPA: hypothetical protein VN896_06935, partial [Methylomirabilota bacterium]|nr:hypothetical protein [Methylomirabilota bacterium]